MTQAKLSAAQAELLESMRKGVAVHYLSGLDSYYFRSDTMRRCSSQVRALLKRGLVEEFDSTWRGAKVRIKSAQS